MAKVIIDDQGTKRYLNDEGHVHRTDGPAVIWEDGSLEYLENNMYTSEPVFNADNGEYVFFEGHLYWEYEKALQRDDGPYAMYPNGYKQWDDGETVWPKL